MAAPARAMGAALAAGTQSASCVLPRRGAAWELFCSGAVRCMSASISYPTTPYRKQLLERTRQDPPKPWSSWTDPRMIAKHMRAGERRARELGVIEDLQAFDEAAAAFPKPPAIVAASMVERPEVIMRDLEDWEADFLTMQFERQQAEARRYPPELLNMITAAQQVVEKEAAPAAGAAGGKAGGKGAKGGKEAAGEGAAAGAAGEGAAPVEEEAAPAAAKAKGAGKGGEGAVLSSFYETASAASQSSAADESATSLVAASRISSADQINDTRSLDRAYTQRLVLLARSHAGAGGGWGLPSALVQDSETMVQAAERAVRSAFQHDADLDLWYPGAGPMGHLLQVFSPAQQEATGRYGAKVFFYRAQILAGRLRAHPAGEVAALAAAATARSGGVETAYDDFMWLSRDECEAHLPRHLYKYLHQVLGGGAGEEFSRRQAWLKRVEGSGLTVAQATGRRAHRVTAARVGGTRLLAAATRRQLELAAQPWTADKAAGLKAETAATTRRLTAQKAISAAVRTQLKPLTLAQAAAAARAAKKAAEAAAGVPPAAAAAAGAGVAAQA